MTQPRQRRHHTRSRRGCLACKRSHNRCDEGRPTCANCGLSGRECSYAPPVVPLGEQRRQKNAVPGASLLQFHGSASLDPFDSLPIQMKFRSRELFSYFTKENYEAACSTNTNYPPELSLLVKRVLPICCIVSDPISLNIDEPMGLRSTLLLAGLHFKLMTGDAQTFDETFFFHKGEAIRFVNNGLGDRAVRARTTFMKMIAILSMLESSTGNLAVAEAHIDGLLTLLEMRESEKPSTGAGEPDSKTKTVQRMLLMAHHFTGAQRSRIVGGRMGHTNPKREKHIRTLADNLSTLRLLPVFFTTFLSSKIDMIDSTAVLASLRGITYAVGQQSYTQQPYRIRPPPPGVARAVCDGSNSRDCVGCRSTVGVMYALTVTHGMSPPQASQTIDTGFLTPWSGLAIAASFYLNGVVGVWNAGLPIESRLLRRLLAMQKKDLELSEEIMLNCKQGREMWLWQLFVAAYFLHTSQAQTDNLDPVDQIYHHHKLDEQLALDPCMFDEHLRRWSLVSGILEWEQARHSLQEIVWPNIPCVDERARELWDEIVFW